MTITETAPNPSRNIQIAWLRLARSRGVGPILFFQLLERLGSVDAAIDRLNHPTAAADYGRKEPIRLASKSDIERELDQIEEAGAHLLTAHDDRYPTKLRHIADPPPIITVRGDPALLANPSVAIVGARNASANGCRFAERCALELAATHLAIVSGLARGIDTAAHRGCLNASGITIAAIASGADIAYPPENAKLMASIADAGAVVTERPWGAAPHSTAFPKRNRIIAGLSIGTLVVEAALRSGSLITARLAAECGREVFAVPGTPGDARHQGTNRLLRDGAHFAESAEDIQTVITPLIEQEIKARSKPASKPPSKPIRRTKPKPAKPIEIKPAENCTKSAPIAGGLDDILLGLIGGAPVPVDELIRQCHASPSSIQDCLLDLEIEGRVERHPGNRVSRPVG